MAKAALVAKSYEVFLCDEAAGVDLMRTITSAFSHCELVIVAATKTYGKQTTSGFSTYEEMNFFVTSKTPYFLIKMTETPGDRWEEDATNFNFSTAVWEYWKPGTPMPAGLPDRVIAKYLAVAPAP